MKRGTTDLPKFKHLMRDLGLPMYAAMGLLEALWHFTAKAAERGNIGRYTNEDIAEAVGWVGIADTLIGVLIARKWIDKSRNHRLIIHDWHIHADDATKKRVIRGGEGWAYLDDVSADGGQRRTTADNGGQRQPVADVTLVSESHGCLPEPVPVPLPEPVPEPEPQPLAVVADDPWGKPARVPIADIRAEASRRIVAARPTNPHLAEVSAMLRAFGMNVSNAALYGANMNATPERVRWLCAKATELVGEGKYTPDNAIGFVINGIRSAKDPDPGPVVETPDQRRLRVLTEAARAQESAA